jgi:hypothetical protein
MGGTSRIAIIDGEEGILGHARQAASHGVRRKITPFGETVKETAIVLKLKRKTLAECKVDGLSGAFSYPEDITGTQMIIWCSGSKKGFQKAFLGVVERVSSNTNLEFALRVLRKIKQAELLAYN